VRVFLSHSREDEEFAREIRRLLSDSGIQAFLDLLDPGRAASSPACVMSYVMGRIEGCTHMIPVVGEGSAGSWWLPFAIGVAAEKGKVVAPYVLPPVEVPEFLGLWPLLRHHEHLRAFATLARECSQAFHEGANFGRSRSERRSAARSFELSLRRRLGQ